MTSGQRPILGNAIKDEGRIAITAAAEEEEYWWYPSSYFVGNDYDNNNVREIMANVDCMDMRDAYDEGDVDVDVDVTDMDVRNAIDVFVCVDGDNDGSRGGTKEKAAAGGLDALDRGGDAAVREEEE